MHPYVNTAVKAARRAAHIVLKSFERLDTIQVSSKAPKDLVTNVDQAAEKEIIDTLLSAYPTHSILSEESRPIKGDDRQWIIDPIDGTTNFIHGIPQFCISIAMTYKGRIDHAVIYDPFKEDLFTASRGEGAQRNSRRLRVGQKKLLKDALIGTGIPKNDPINDEIYFTLLKQVTQNSLAVRDMGSAALHLAYVAAGQLDGFFQLDLKPWDIAAGALLVKEAGGLITDANGNENYLKTGSVVCGNPKIFKQLLMLVQPALKAANPS
ncbi:MAG: inositol monophosphatase family protein [Pseudomonadota bacterium]|nr:inositol monophosphatase [Gammaproteobacteria bacterium]MBU1558357.1 inositol monophosphatase [Gammaproteobacteria bacterium]MBU1628723.1 inositol monophosphatase [Gammaproteobacteria bacterium]MBU1927181.1 inositol monophosphatase [Gammaproteobacteria bacterium]MBU2546388.1 inositol monophosphatase [Gammaproteobacteria bacterium]